MFAFLLLLLQQLMTVLGFAKGGQVEDRPCPQSELERGHHIGLRFRAPFTVKIHES